MSIRESAQNFHNFCPKYLPPLFEFSHCSCPNFPIAFARISGKSNGKFGQKAIIWQIRAKAMGNSGKNNAKIWAKAMRKLGKRWHIFRANIIAFARISHYFSSNFPLLLPEFSILFSVSIAFARISYCFCPNFLLLLPEFFCFHFVCVCVWGGGGGTGPPPPPLPPHTPMQVILN